MNMNAKLSVSLMEILSMLILILVLIIGFIMSVSVFLALIAPSAVAETRKRKRRASQPRGLLKDFSRLEETYTLNTQGKGKFGRYLGTISDETETVNKALINEHLAVVYYGQNKDEVEAAHLKNRSRYKRED